MSDPFLAEIRIMSFNFPPRGWAMCNGQLLPVAQNQALFSLLGTTYGGNGVTNFALPDLRGRVPVHPGNKFRLGQQAGEETHTLTNSEMPVHSHALQASGDKGTSNDPTSNLFAASQNFKDVYGPSTNLVNLHPQTVGFAGNSQPHQNMQPFQALNFCIAIQGIFPPSN